MMNLKKIIILLTLGLLFTPLFFSLMEPMKLKKLSGAYTLPDTVELNMSTWHTGEFQSKYTPFYEYKIGLREVFVRLRNQLAFSAFNKSTSYVTIGKNDNLYTWGYLEAYKGIIKFDQRRVSDTVLYLQAIQEALKEQDKEFLVVVAPNKVRVHPEILSVEDSNIKNEKSMYAEFLSSLNETSINFIDFNDWFVKNKNDFEAPVFPSTGIHWSMYGASLAADSLNSYLGYLVNKEVVDFNVVGYEDHSEPHFSELDLMHDLNLIYDFEPDGLKYPIIKYDSLNASNKYKPHVFVISDSFYWNLLSLGLQEDYMSNQSMFWFYNNTAYGDGKYGVPTKSLNKSEVLKGKDVVVLMATEANLKKFPYGFIDSYRDILSLDDRVEKIRIQATRDLLKESIDSLYYKVLDMEGVTYSSVGDTSSIKRGILKKCEYAVLFDAFTEEKSLLIDKYKDIIINSEEWYGNIKNQAAINNIPVEDELYNNALYMFDTNEKERLIASFGEVAKYCLPTFISIEKNQKYLGSIKDEATKLNKPLNYVLAGHVAYVLFSNKPK